MLRSEVCKGAVAVKRTLNRSEETLTSESVYTEIGAYGILLGTVTIISVEVLLTIDASMPPKKTVLFEVIALNPLP